VVRTPEDQPSEAEDADNIDEALSIECLGEELLDALRRVSRKISDKCQDAVAPSDMRINSNMQVGVKRPADHTNPLSAIRVTSNAAPTVRATQSLSGQNTLPASVPKGGLAPGALRRVTEYMQQRLSEQVCLSELADIAGLSESHFARAFRESVGEPPHRYLMLLRVRAAATLIEATNTPLSEISLAVGFADQSHLTRLFIRLVGERPREYRRRHR
jgi:AraC-like DNA-binding protein